MRTLLLIAMLGLLGCQKEDGDKLLRVARVATNNIRNATPQKTPLAELNDSQPVSRVRQRLFNDIYLADSRLEVTLEEGVCVLRGRVPNGECRVRAGELASSTLGITAVRNEIEVEGKQ